MSHLGGSTAISSVFIYDMRLIHLSPLPSDYYIIFIIMALLTDAFFAFFGLDPCKNYGPEGILPIVLKLCASVVSPPCSNLSSSVFLHSNFCFSHIQAIPKQKFNLLSAHSLIHKSIPHRQYRFL